jgi:hypothetical protein
VDEYTFYVVLLAPSTQITSTGGFWNETMPHFSPVGWVTLIGIILLVLSLFVAQAADGERNKVLFHIANAMTLLGVLGLAIGVFCWIFS